MKGLSWELSFTVAYPLRLERHCDIDDVWVDGEVWKLWGLTRPLYEEIQIAGFLMIIFDSKLFH